MAIAVATNSTTAYGTRSTLTVTKPTGTSDDDLLVAVVGVYANGTVNTAPAGWSVATSQQQVTNANLSTYIYYKVASSEGASWDWTMSGSVICFGHVMRVTGATTVTPFDDGNSEGINNDSTPSYSIGFTPAFADQLYVGIMVGDGANATPTNFAIATDNPTWTTEYSGANAGDNTGYYVVSAVRSAATTTGNVSLSYGSGNDEETACSFAAFSPTVSVTVNVTPLIIASTLPNATISGDANITVTPLTLSATLTAATTTLKSIWTKLTRSSSSWTRQNKS